MLPETVRRIDEIAAAAQATGRVPSLVAGIATVFCRDTGNSFGEPHLNSYFLHPAAAYHHLSLVPGQERVADQRV